MGRREASEKGTWKLEKEQTKYVWLCYLSRCLKRWLIIRFLFQVSPLLTITSSLAWLHVRTPWPCPFPTRLYCRTSHACSCEHARKIGQSWLSWVFLDWYVNCPRTVQSTNLLLCMVSIVKQSKNPCLVGLSGIVIHETENAFKVVTQRDTLKCPLYQSLLSISLLTLPTIKQCFPSRIPSLHSQYLRTLLYRLLYWQIHLLRPL